MPHFDQGPGRNIEFCLISTGIDIDPHHGSESREYYEWLKSVIQSRAELHFEDRSIRELVDSDVSGILEGYDPLPLRNVYQFLFGIVEHSNPWTEETLTEAIDQTPFPRSLDPKDGDYSIDFFQSTEDGMTLFENKFILGSDVWVEHSQFYYSSSRPVQLDGTSGDVWFVVADDLITNGINTIEIWYKPAFRWIKLSDYVSQLTPAGSFTISQTDPGNSTNDWWLDMAGINIRRYSVALNSWEPASSVIVSTTQPTGLSDGDLWLKIFDDSLSLFVFDGTLNTFIRVGFSKRIVQDRDTNTAFVGESGKNNFIIVCGDLALEGAPFLGGQALRVKKDGILVQSMVNCINIIGPDLQVTALGPGEVDIEHLPFTTLPEQPSAPPATPDDGKIFTLDIGGVTELFYRDDTGTVIQITNNGVTVQNIFLNISTSNAVSGQTVFSLPGTARAVLTTKVNGVDTTAWSFTNPSVTYNPAAGGYTIQTGDVVTILYYGQ